MLNLPKGYLQLDEQIYNVIHDYSDLTGDQCDDITTQIINKVIINYVK